MNDQSNEAGRTNNVGTGVNRRGFLQGAAVGAIGTIAASTAFARTAVGQEAPDQELEKPKGLGRRGMVDQRFPVTYQTSMPKGVSLVTQYFVALSERNLKGIADVLHFPFGSFEAIDAVLVKTPEDLIAHAPASMNMSEHPERFTDQDGYLIPGAYDVFEGLEVLNVDPGLCAMAMTYSRYGPDGKKLHRCDGIYTVTNNDGQWAIQAMSTIFTPAHMIGMVFPETLGAVQRLRVNGDLEWNVSDRYVASAEHGATFQPGSRLNVARGGSPWNLGPAGMAMDEFKFKGVKSRLIIITAEEAAAAPPRTTAPSAPQTREQQLADYANYRKMLGTTTGEAWGWVVGMMPAGESRVIHHTVNKAHMCDRIWRGTASGQELNYSSALDIVTFRRGRWGMAGTFAYTTPHDRANDVDVPGPLFVPPQGLIYPVDFVSSNGGLPGIDW